MVSVILKDYHYLIRMADKIRSIRILWKIRNGIEDKTIKDGTSFPAIHEQLKSGEETIMGLRF